MWVYTEKSSAPVVHKSFFRVNLRNQLQGGNLVLNASFAPGPGRFRSRVLFHAHRSRSVQVRVLFHAHRSRSVQVPCFIPCPQVQVGSGLSYMWPKTCRFRSSRSVDLNLTFSLLCLLACYVRHRSRFVLASLLCSCECHISRVRLLLLCAC